VRRETWRLWTVGPQGRARSSVAPLKAPPLARFDEQRSRCSEHGLAIRIRIRRRLACAEGGLFLFHDL